MSAPRYRWRAQDDATRIEGDRTFDEVAVVTKAGGCWLHVEQMDAKADGTGSYYLTLGNRQLWFLVRDDGSVKVTHYEDHDGPDFSRPSNRDEWPEMKAHAPERPRKVRK